MKKTLLFLAFFVSACNTNINIQEQESVHETLVSMLRPLSYECRRAFLVGFHLDLAQSFKAEHELVYEAFSLCEAYSFYVLKPIYINAISEGSGQDLSESSQKVQEMCAESFANNTDSLNYIYEQAEKTLKPYAIQQLKKCPEFEPQALLNQLSGNNNQEKKESQ